MQNRGWLFLGVMMILAGCYQDEDGTTSTYVPDPVELEVEGHVAFIVTNTDGAPVEEIHAVLNAQQDVSDANGYLDFDLDQIALDQTTISYTRHGYFSMTSRVEAVAGQTLLQDLPIFKLENGQRQGSRTGSHSSAEIQFSIPENGLQTSDGKSDINEYYLMAKKLGDQEIGLWKRTGPSLLTTKKNGQRQLLNLSHAFLLEARTIDQEVLSLTKPITIDVQVSALGGAEKFFQLNQYGFFEELLIIQQSEDIYQLEVSRLMPVIVATSIPAQRVEIKLLSQDGSEMANMAVSVEVGKVWKTGKRTTNRGYLVAWVTGEQDWLNVFSICGSRLTQAPIEVDKKEMTLDWAEDEFFELSGSVWDCDRNLQGSGYIIGEGSKGKWIMPVGFDGRFRAYVPYCETEEVQLNYNDKSAGGLIYTTVLTAAKGENNTQVYACDKDDLSESILIVGSDQKFFDQCVMGTHQENGVLVEMTFLNVGDNTDEIHLYQRVTDNGKDFWYSSSSFNDLEYSLIQIPSQPEISEFIYLDVAYLEIKFNDLLFENSSKDQVRGSAQYIVRKR